MREDELAFIVDQLSGFSNTAFLVPPKILDRYMAGQPDERKKLDEEYRISACQADLRLHAQNIVLYKTIMHDLSKFLNCPPNMADILQARNMRSANYRDYIGQICDDARIDVLNVDDGYSELAVRHAMPTIDLEQFQTYVPARIVRTTRVEPLLQKSLDASSRFDDMESDFISSLEDAVKRRGAVALKCVIAYRSGLFVQKTRVEEAKKDFKEYKSKRRSVRAGRPVLKNLRNYLIWNAVRKSIDLNVPFQFHTGVGDVDILMRECNPACLWDLLVDEELRRARVVLVHSGYPYVSEAAFLTGILPNVYLDLSILVPMAAVNPGRIAEVFELAPLTKVMYASDHALPETYWLSAKVAKKMLGDALGKIVDGELLDEDEAYQAGELVLSGNAKRLFKL
jgi:predicted TIM-barrel fold metal-dependent hydrolase